MYKMRSRILVASKHFLWLEIQLQRAASFSPTHDELIFLESPISDHFTGMTWASFNDTFWSIKMQCWIITCHFIFKSSWRKHFTMRRLKCLCEAETINCGHLARRAACLYGSCSGGEKYLAMTFCGKHSRRLSKLKSILSFWAMVAFMYVDEIF